MSCFAPKSLKSMDFRDFQNASPRKCRRQFLSYSTQLKYYGVVQSGRLSASVLFSILPSCTSEVGQKLDFFVTGFHGFARFWPCSGYSKLVLQTRARVFRPWKHVNITQKSLPTHPFALANYLHHFCDRNNNHTFLGVIF